MERAIGAFALRAATADASLFYYGGHGLQVASRNYLVPVDAELRGVDDVDRRTVPLDDVFDALAKAKGLHLVFLDACRNNPLKDLNAALRAPGLARVGDAAGFLVAFATQPDNVAYDGAGRNSPFARALLAHVATPGVDVSSMMIAVRRDVIAATGGAQIPWENSSLTQQFYFGGETAGDGSPEALLWRLAGGERDPALLQIYLERYPDGAHAGDVRTLLAAIGPSAKPAPASARGDLEALLWRLALSGRERRLVELYLARYPAGAHAREAQALLASLRAAQNCGRRSRPGLRTPGDPSARRDRLDPGRRAAGAARRRGGGDRRLRRSRGGPSRDRPLHRVAGARRSCRRPHGRRLGALSPSRRRRRRAGDVQPRTDAGDGRPRAEGSEGGLRAIRQGGRARPRRRGDQSRGGAG